MKIEVLPVLVPFLAFCNAAPTAGADPGFSFEITTAEAEPELARRLDETMVSGDVEGALTKRASINDCGASTFLNQGSDGSPLVADCKTINRNIAGGGTFEVGCGEGQLVKAKFGTCQWAAKCTPQGLNNAFIGNQDIIDTINSSIQKFGARSPPKVGSKGVMNCQSIQGGGLSQKITWYLYHT